MTDQNKSVLEGIRELTSHIIARAAEIEAARRIPLDIVQSLKSAGVFRMFVSRRTGAGTANGARSHQSTGQSRWFSRLDRYDWQWQRPVRLLTATGNL